MNIKYLIAKTEQAHGGLGWRQGGAMDMGYNVEEVGDVWLYIDIHNSAMGGNLLDCLNKHMNYLKNIFGDSAKKIEFFENETSPSGYCVAIELDRDYDDSEQTITEEE